MNSPEYLAWRDMNRRCGSPSHPDFPGYGGRGILVCDAWKNSFSAFLQSMGPRPNYIIALPIRSLVDGLRSKTEP